MSLLERIFGKRHSAHRAGRWSWAEHGAWIDLREQLTEHYAVDLIDAGQRIAEHKGGTAFMSGMISVEPYPNHWGHTLDEVHRTFGKTFLGQIQFLRDNQGHSNVFGNFTDDGPFGSMIKDLPEILRSMEARTFRFVLGTQKDGRRAIGLLVFR